MAVAGFYGDTLAEAVRLSQTAHLGARHWEPHPEEGHLHTEVKTAIDNVTAKWRMDSPTELADVNLAYLSGVMTIPKAKTPWEIAAAAAAADKSSGC